MYRLHVTASSRIDIVTSQPLKVNSRKELRAWQRKPTAL